LRVVGIVSYRLLRRLSRFLRCSRRQPPAGQGTLGEGSVPDARRARGQRGQRLGSAVLVAGQLRKVQADCRAGALAVLPLGGGERLDVVGGVSLALESSPDLAEGLRIVGIEVICPLQLRQTRLGLPAREEDQRPDAVCFRILWKQSQRSVHCCFRFLEL